VCGSVPPSTSGLIFLPTNRHISNLNDQPPVKMNTSQPVASYIASVDLRYLTSDEIEALSVKQIHNRDTFDTLLHPTPGGLYDPALGAWADNL
jgi:hypothetical protein